MDSLDSFGCPLYGKNSVDSLRSIGLKFNVFKDFLGLAWDFVQQKPRGDAITQLQIVEHCWLRIGDTFTFTTTHLH